MEFKGFEIGALILWELSKIIIWILSCRLVEQIKFIESTQKQVTRSNYYWILLNPVIKVGKVNWKQVVTSCCWTKFIFAWFDVFSVVGKGWVTQPKLFELQKNLIVIELAVEKGFILCVKI